MYDDGDVHIEHMKENIKNNVPVAMEDLRIMLMEEMAITYDEAITLVRFFVEEFEHLLAHNALLRFPQIGTFYCSYKDPSTFNRRNPYTGEAVYVPAGRQPRYRPSARLINRMNIPSTYGDKYANADEHTLLVEEQEYDLDDPTFKTFDEGIIKGYTEKEIEEELLRQAKETDHYYTLDTE